MSKTQYIIIWISTAILTFLFGYFNSSTSQFQPVTGTTGIDGKQVSYSFPRKANISDTLRLMLISDIDTLKAITFLDGKIPKQISFESTGKNKTLVCTIPLSKLPDTITYRVAIIKNDSLLFIPQNSSNLTTICMAKVPSQIMQAFYFTLFGGLLLSIRVGLEYFTDGKKIKKLTLFTTALFGVYGVLFVPAKNTFEMNFLNKIIAQPNQLFELSALSYFAFWIAASIAIFKVKHQKLAALIAGIGTVIIFLIVD